MSPRPVLLTLAGGLLCAAPLHAADPAPAKTEAPTAKTDAAPVKAEAPVEPYQLKNRSSFSCAGESARVPFWPIGWIHRPGSGTAVAQAAAPKAAFDEKSFRVTSILLGTGTTGSLAVINGRAYSEGEFLKTPRPAAVPGVTPVKTATPPSQRIRIQRIGDGTVILQREDQTVTLSLQRPELAQKKADEQLLLEEQ